MVSATSIAIRAASLGVELAKLEVTVESIGDPRGLPGLDGVSAGYASIAALRPGRGDPARRQLLSCALGVEREIASSSSVMSAGTSANSGVLR
jgi:hypothetical protein